MIAMLALPIAAPAILSFWTQNGFELDRTPTLEIFALIVAVFLWAIGYRRIRAESMTMLKTIEGIWIYAIFFVLFLYGPVLLMPVFDLNDGTFATFPMKGFTLKNFSAMAANTSMIPAFQNSLRIAVAVAVLSTVLARTAALALTLSDRIPIMADGRVLQIDSPRGLYERPSNRRVAEVIGTMNLISGRIGSVAGGTAGLDAGPLGRFEAPAVGALAAGNEAFLALRPEKLVLSEAGATARLEGRVSEAAHLGDRIHHQVAVAGLERPLAVAVNILAHSTGFGLGAEVGGGRTRAGGVGLILGP